MINKRNTLAALLGMAMACQSSVILAEQPAAQTIFVDAVNGDDASSGTEQKPVRSLARAQSLVREKNDDMKADLNVCLKEGTYVLDEALTFTSEDSGTNGFSVIWTAAPGEKATISGGQKITDWSPVEGKEGVWSASAKGIESRDFYVNGKRALRSRQEVKAYEFRKKYIYLDAQTLPESFERTSDLEVVFAKKWKWAVHKVASCTDNDDYENCRRIKITDESYNANKANMTGAAIDDAGMAEGVRYLENALELLDEPGEWYLNTETDTIYYMPAEGEDLAKSDAVLGKAETLIRFAGTAEASVENISLKNLTFANTTWNKPSHDNGLQTFQAAAIIDPEDDWNREWIPADSSALYAVYDRGLSVEGCTFENLGNAGINFGRATKNSVISRNTFTGLGGTAVLLGNTEMADHVPVPADLVSDNTISNNRINDVAQVYRGNAGLSVLFARGTVIDHNEVTNLPYTGISVGWGWGYNDFNANTYFRIGRNSITNNLIKDVLTEERLIDGGGIYTLGRQDDSVITGNVIDGVHNEYGGIYLDEGSVGFTVTDNVVTNCVRNFLYKGDYNYIFDNFSTYAKEPDRDERLAIGAELQYRFENNDQWDQKKVDALYESAGISPEPASLKLTMHRLYNPNSGEHFYTHEAEEKENLLKAGWKDEGTGWIAPVKSSQPVFRLYNANAGDHHYTMSEEERDALIQSGWKDEGIGWYSAPGKEVALYRAYNPNAKAGSHHYTQDLKEYIHLGKQGWNQEDIAWYGLDQ